MNLYVIRQLTKRYEPGGVLANDSISLDIRQGEIVGIFGPNGAGKTTFVRQITALLRPSSGSIELLGQDIVRHPEVVPRYVSFFGQRTPILRNYKVAEVLDLRGRTPGPPRRPGQATGQRADRTVRPRSHRQPATGQAERRAGPPLDPPGRVHGRSQGGGARRADQ